MSRLPYLACAAALFMIGAKPQTEMFAKYKPVEAYEIRPGVLAMPRYTEDGRVCEVGVEKRSYSPDLIWVGESFSQKEIDQIVDVLAPADERGPRQKGLLGGVMFLSGRTYSNATVYENITVLS